jgi:DICT domain-containing protein
MSADQSVRDDLLAEVAESLLDLAPFAREQRLRDMLYRFHDVTQGSGTTIPRPEPEFLRAALRTMANIDQTYVDRARTVHKDHNMADLIENVREMARHAYGGGWQR